MRRRRPTALLLLLVLVAGAAFFVWRFLGDRDAVGLDRSRRAPTVDAAASSDGQPPAGERELAARSADGNAPPPVASDVAIEPTPEHGVPVVVVAHGSGEPQPFALVTRIESPWDDRADAHSHRDVNWLLDHLGRRFRADERGFVRIPPSAGRLELFARVGALAGCATLAPGEVKARDDTPPKRIEVAPLADLRVRVVDPEGSPVAGVPLLVIGEGGGRTLSSILDKCESTAPDGLAEVRGASLLIDDGAPPGGLLVRVQLQLRHPVSLQVARAELDGKPRTLVMPATGSVELVLVDEHGNVPAVDDSEWFTLLRAPRRGSMPTEEEQLRIGDEISVRFESGRAQIPFVELGDWVEAEVDCGVHGDAFVQAEGPTIAGSSARIDVLLHADPHAVAFHGRAVDPEQQPVAHRALSGTFRWIAPDEPNSVSFSATTGADGAFEFSLKTPEESRPGRQWTATKLVLTIDRTDGGFDLARGLEPDVELARRGGELGTVVFERPPLLASGVVVDDDGEPVQHVSITLTQKGAALVPIPGHESDFNVVFPAFSTRSEADGTFTILGHPGRGVFGLSVVDDRYLSPPPIPIEPGATGVRIVVSRPATLLAHVLLDPGVPPKILEGWICVPHGGDAGRDLEEWLVPNARGDLLFENLPPRPAAVEIRADCFGSRQELIARFDAIPLTAGERTVDPRMQAIDLRGRFQSTHLVVVDPDGEPVQNVIVRAKLDSSGDGSQDVRADPASLEFGVDDLVTTGTPPLIDVEAKGFLTQRAALTPPQTRITLRRGLEVVVELDPSLPVLPESCFYAITLTPGSFTEDAGAARDFLIVKDSAPSMRVERPGDFTAQLWLGRYMNRTSFGMNELKSGRAQLRIEDSESATKIHLTATAAEVKATLTDLGL